MDDLLNEFLTETAESIEVVDSEVVKLEQDPSNKSVLDNIFRLVHTIKGTCGFLGLPRLEAVAHAAENVLGKFRDGEIEVTPEAVTVILEALDQIKAILGELEANEAEPEGDDSDLIGRLNAVITGGEAATTKSDPEPEPEPEAAAAAEESSVSPLQEATLDELEAAFQAAPGPDDDEDDAAASETGDDSLFERLGGDAAVEATIKIFYDKVLADADLKPFFDGINMDSQRQMLGAFLTMAFGGPANYSGRSLAAAHAPLVARGLGEAHFDAVAGHLHESLKELEVADDLIDEIMTIAGSVKDDVLCRTEEGQKLVAACASAASEPPAKAEQGASSGTPRKAAGESTLKNQTIRVSVDVLEDLMTMVSELVLTRNQLDQMVRNLEDSEFTVPLQRLSNCTSELQEAVMKTRMQPIGNAWAKLPRIVRDLCHELGKKIELDMRGAETELDRQVLELIKDPLTHMVRNSGDHGIETPEERLAAGKPATGKIILNSYQEGGHIMIEISDDGRGLNTEKIKEKALANGLVTQAELDSMTDQQIHRFIFHAGLSTAEKVTAVSGRGVGMDVVRSNIEKIGGTVDVKSIEGAGSTFTIKIPLTLAIISALIVEVSDERFAIPQLNVLELVRASASSEHRIEHINNTPVLRLRNRLLPLIFLRDVLGFESQTGDDEDGRPDETFVVVSQVGNFIFGIVVDRVFDTEEIVVKPIAPILRDIPIYSGNTILGDGSVIMILDANGIAAVTDENMHHGGEVEEGADIGSTVQDDRETLLTFKAGDDAPKAVPLSLVARLEEIDVGKIETSDGRPVVQYRGSLMPLVTLRQDYAFKTEGRQPILVFADGQRSMGLAVDQIVDIVEDKFNVELVSNSPGVLGTAVIAGEATEIVDVGHYLSQAFADWFKAPSADTASVQAHRQPRVLLVDDSPFFRNMIKPLLVAAGYDVTVVEAADKALELRDMGMEYDIIISDVEMPGMDGFEFAETVKSDGPWQDTPIIALSSQTTESAYEKGRQVGFTDYVAKFDRDTLLDALSQTLSVKGEAA